MATFTVDPAKNPDGDPSTVTTTGKEATPDVLVAIAPTDVTVPVAVVVGWARAPAAAWASLLAVPELPLAAPVAPDPEPTAPPPDPRPPKPPPPPPPKKTPPPPPPRPVAAPEVEGVIVAFWPAAIRPICVSSTLRSTT